MRVPARGKTLTALPTIPHETGAAGSRAGRGIVVAVTATMLLLSSITPFLRFGDGAPRFSGADIVDAVLLLAAWLPVVMLLALLLRLPAVRRATAWWSLFGALSAMPIAVAIHTATFLSVQRLLEPDAAPSAVAAPVLFGLGVLQYLVAMTVVLGVAAATRLERSRREAAETGAAAVALQRQLVDARLDALRSQLQPHFLFNTLNTISGLVTQDPDAARRMLVRLSDLLRASLAEGERTTVPLARELELAAAYLDIQQVRFGDRLVVETHVDPDVLPAAVPTMILQPVIENAIVHGIGSRVQGGRVTIRASAREHRLSLTVSDDGPGVSASTMTARDRSGIGLRALHARLEQQYGDAFRLTLSRGGDGTGCTTSIEIPLHRDDG